jgi:hypothetical protein
MTLGCRTPRRGQDCPEVQIMREDDLPMRTRPGHDRFISGAGIANL